MNRWVLIAVFLATVFGSYLAHRMGLTALSEDDFMRVWVAYRWMLNPQLLQIAIWPPLYSVVYGNLFRFGLDPLLSAQIVTSLFSASIPLLAAWLAREFGGSRQTAYWTALLVMLSPLQVALAASSLSEPMFCFFVLLCVVATVRWLKTDQRHWLWLATLSCLLFCMTRLEGWALAAAWTSLILWRRKFQEAWPSLVVVAAFPAIWLSMIHHDFGSISALFQAQVEISGERFPSRWNAFIAPLEMTARLFPLAAISFAVGLFSFKKLKKDTRIVWSLFAFFVLFVCATAFKLLVSVYPDRAVILPGVLGTIAFSRMASDLCGSSRKYRWLFGVVLILVLPYQAIQISKIRPEYDREAESIGKMFKRSAILESKPFQNGVGSDLDSAHLPIVAVTSGQLKKWRSISLVEGRALLPYPNPPSVFFVQNGELADKLEKTNPSLQRTQIGKYFLLK